MADMHEQGDERRNATETGNTGPDSVPGSSGTEGTPGQDLSETDSLRLQIGELKEKNLRLTADFENYRKRTERETGNMVRFAIEKFAVELIEVIDNFDRALAADPASSREGLEQISKLFRTILEAHGITPVESVGRKFNPAEHEALVCIPSESEEGVVIGEICKGYRMHDRIIRCAKVAVSKGQESE